MTRLAAIGPREAQPSASQACRDATKKPRPRPEYKRVWASLTRTPQDIIAEANALALKRDPEHKKRWLVLVDGCPKLERWVRAEARRVGVEITLVLDFIHALESLWKAAHAFLEEGTPAIEAWVLQRLEWMLEGKISNVVVGMTRMATVRGLTTKARAPGDKAANYLLTRKDMMRYGELLALGAPIASGVIEGACRHLINDRLDLTGAQWRLPSAEAVLRLRSMLSSEDRQDRTLQVHGSTSLGKSTAPFLGFAPSAAVIAQSPPVFASLHPGEGCEAGWLGSPLRGCESIDSSL